MPSTTGTGLRFEVGMFLSRTNHLNLMQLLWISFFFSAQSLWAAIPWCIDKESSADKNQLRCLKNTEVAQQVRRSFDLALKHRKACPRCPRLSVTEDEFISLYHLPFLVIAITYPDHGTGCDVHVVFKERPNQEYEVRMEYLPNETYRLLVIGDTDPSTKITKLIQQLHNKEYEEFWIQ